jgi:magnesium transporter
MADLNLDHLEPAQQLEQIVVSSNSEHLASFWLLLDPAEISYTISHLEEHTRTRMLEMLSEARPQLAADLIEHLADEQAADLIEELEPTYAAAIVNQMDSDEQTDVLGEMDEDDADAILQKMDPLEAADARQRLQYEEDTAGGLMMTEYLAYRDDRDVDDVIADLRHRVEEDQQIDVHDLYVIDPQKHLVGVMPMRALLLAPRGTKLVNLMAEDPKCFGVDTHLDELDAAFDFIDCFAVPVLDAQGRLLGIVQRDAIEEALSERSDENLLKVSGIIGGEELRTMPLVGRCLRRLAFLLPILVLLLVSASIIALYENTVSRLPILAAFLPVVAGLCGSGGNQAVAVSMREIALGLIKPNDFFRVLGKEITVGLINGLLLGAVLMGVVGVWQGDWMLAGIVGGVIPLTIVLAVGVGGAVPVLLKGMRLDPAMASGPIVTTTVDLFSFFIVLLFASRMLG